MHKTTIDRLREYSLAIQKLEFQYLDYQCDREIIQDKLNLFNDELELEIANDSSLRNEGMRKAQKTISQKTSKQYQDLLGQLRTIEGRLARTAIDLDRHKREFEIIKLEAKAQIASIAREVAV